MRILPILLLLAVLATAKANTIVQLDTAYGSMKFELYDTDKPITVTNFLKYITSGRYENSFAHRLEPGFVLQGGGFTLEGNTIDYVPSYGTILNEYSAGTTYSNIYGTIAMARSSGVNSATSQWFINLKDNSFLDSVNEGFTVFGHIIEGMDVLEDFLDFIYLPQNTTNATDVVVNASSIGSVFNQLPVQKVTNNTYGPTDLVYTEWSIIPVPEPSTYALLVIGSAFGIIAFRRLRAA